jgi:hypothetical protein
MAIPISNVPRRVQYAPSGVGPYAFTFEILVQTDLAVYQGSTLLTLTANYTVSINPNGTGSVTLTSAATDTITIVGARAIQRTTDFVTGGDFRANTVNDEMDSQTIFSQQLAEELGRAFKVPAYTPATGVELAPEPGYLLAWDDTGSAIENVDPKDIATLATASKAFSDTFVGNGSTVAFTLSRNPGTTNNIGVSINGATQVPNVDYSVSGTTLTFTTAPPLNAVVLARYFEALTLTSGDAESITYVPAGTGAANTTVQAKLRETVSVKDFGAVGDGVTDDTAAIQACFEAVEYLTNISGQFRDAVTVHFPKGTYRITDTLIVPRAFANEGYNLIQGDGYLGTILLWDGLADRIFIDGANTIQNPNTPAGTPRLSICSLTLDVKSGAGKPACGIALWAEGQHPSHQSIYDLRIVGCKAGMALRQGISYTNSSGVVIPADTHGFAPQDSIYRNIIIESCDYGVICGHTHNKYEQFRVTALIHNYIIKTASFGTFDNCYSGASTLAAFIGHVLIVGTGGAGLQIFRNCWFEGSYDNLANPIIGDAVDYAIVDASATTGTFSVNVIFDSCLLANSEFMLRTNTGVSASVWVMGGWAIQGYQGDGLNCNRIKLADSSSALLYNTTGIDAEFVQYSPAGFAGTLTDFSIRRPAVNELTYSLTNADPASSGSTRTDFGRVMDSAGSRALDYGISNSYAWFQSRDKNNFGVNYDLALNPNGGDVYTGKDLYVGQGAWNTGHFALGNYHIWVDSTGDLRIKNGQPTSDTDGTVVGTQT